MPHSMNPSVGSTKLTLVTAAPGLSSQTIHNEITRPLEEHLELISEVTACQSSSKNSLSVIHLNFLKPSSASEALPKIQKIAERFEKQLHSRIAYVFGPFVQQLDDRTPFDALIAAQWIDSASHIRELDALRKSMATEVEKLNQSDLVKSVQLIGVPRKAIIVSYKDEDLNAAGMTSAAFPAPKQNTTFNARNCFRAPK